MDTKECDCRRRRRRCDCRQADQQEENREGQEPGQLTLSIRPPIKTAEAKEELKLKRSKTQAEGPINHPHRKEAMPDEHTLQQEMHAI
jgi:hypothetical protein